MNSDAEDEEIKYSVMNYLTQGIVKTSNIEVKKARSQSSILDMSPLRQL